MEAFLTDEPDGFVEGESGEVVVFCLQDDLQKKEVNDTVGMVNVWSTYFFDTVLLHSFD